MGSVLVLSFCISARCGDANAQSSEGTTTEVPLLAFKAGPLACFCIQHPAPNRSMGEYHAVPQDPDTEEWVDPTAAGQLQGRAPPLQGKGRSPPLQGKGR